MYSEKTIRLLILIRIPNRGRLAASKLREYFGTYPPTTNLNANRIETDQDLLNDTKNGNIAISNEGKIKRALNL
jgi:hypothetical protein